MRLRYKWALFARAAAAFEDVGRDPVPGVSHVQQHGAMRFEPRCPGRGPAFLSLGATAIDGEALASVGFLRCTDRIHFVP